MQLAGFLFQFFYLFDLVLLYLEHTFDEQFVTGKEKVEPEHAHLHVNNKGIFLAKLTYFQHGLGTLDLMVTLVHSETHWPMFLFFFRVACE